MLGVDFVVDYYPLISDGFWWFKKFIQILLLKKLYIELMKDIIPEK